MVSTQLARGSGQREIVCILPPPSHKGANTLSPRYIYTNHPFCTIIFGILIRILELLPQFKAQLLKYQQKNLKREKICRWVPQMASHANRVRSVREGPHHSPTPISTTLFAGGNSLQLFISLQFFNFFLKII